MQMANTYRIVKPLSQNMLSQGSYEGEDHILQNIPKRFPICDKCKLQRPQRSTEAIASVVQPSLTFLREPDPEWLSQGENVSSMKLLSMLMLNAWRQRRNEVKELQQVMENIKDENMKYKNQMHVYSTLVRVEQKRNDELTLQLKLSVESVNEVRYSCDSLTSSVLNLTADKEQLRQELEIRKQESEAQKLLLQQTKSDLYRSLHEKRDLQTRLSKEQRALQEAEEDQKHVLERLKCVLAIGDKMRISEEDYLQELKKREDTIQKLYVENLTLKAQVQEEKKDHNLQSCIRSKESMSQTMFNMNAEIVSLKAQLEEQTKVVYSFVTANANNRISTATWETMLLSFVIDFVNVVFYLLPAMPSSSNDNKTNTMDKNRKMLKNFQS